MQMLVCVCVCVCAGGAGPMARLKAAASMRQGLQLPQQAQGSKLFKHVPARLPPSQKAINAWLDAESALYAPAPSSSKDAAAQAAAGSGFVMDANTGRLVPLQASATQVAASTARPGMHSPIPF